MEYGVIEWQGFSGVEFDFQGSLAKVIKPKTLPNGKWALKTEYFGAFPSAEIELLNRGWHIAYQKNDNRWATEKDIRRKADFVRFVSREFSLNPRCAMVGMSCGGLFAVMLAAGYPELADVLYLDAPVLNLLSCPCDLGVAKSGVYEEFYRCTGMTKSEMLSYRNHPIDNMHVLYENDIPVVLAVGDSDTIVPYCENGLHLSNYYESVGGRLRLFIKEGCGHHPHGFEDGSIIANAIEELSEYKD